MDDKNDLTLSSHITIKLFETLSDSNKKVQEQLEKQTEALDALIRQLREGVQLSELKELIKSGEEQITEMNECTETVSGRSDEIIKVLNDQVLKILIDVRDKLTKVIIVITITFSLLTIGYFIVKAVVDFSSPKPQSQYEQVIKDIEEIKSGMKKYHTP